MPPIPATRLRTRLPWTTVPDVDVLRDLGKVVAFSPHLDDGVLSCGGLLSACRDALVVTVFAGIPPDDLPLTDWDRRCGYGDGPGAMRGRRAEDVQALACLRARGLHLDFLDSQYGQPPAPARLAFAMRAVLHRERPDTVLVPLGLFHADHLLVQEVAMKLRAEESGLLWLAYEDVPYRRKRGLLQHRLMRLYAQGVSATPAAFGHVPRARRKAAAVAAYASQLRPMGLAGGQGDPVLPERYWRLESGVE